jgi:antitoxin ParD1/3/4
MRSCAKNLDLWHKQKPLLSCIWCIYGVKKNHIHITLGGSAMTRQSISFTAPNDNWLNSLIKNEEYNSKSEIVNDLIRKARAHQDEIEIIRARLIKSENSGFITQTTEEIRAEFKEELRRNGEL